MKLRSWGVTDVGQKRSHNEDFFLIDDELNLFLVADGMGGLERGDMASRLTCEVVRDYIRRERAVIDAFRDKRTPETRDELTQMIESAVVHACAEVYAVAERTQGRGMGTTLEVLLLTSGVGFLAHVGDSRIFLFRGGQVHQLTEDHSLVQEKVRQGLLTREEARHARKRNVITRAVGVLPTVKVDTLSFEVDQGDSFLLCSDGLHQYYSDGEMLDAVNACEREDAAPTLVEQANERGGSDNITALFVEVVTSIPREFWDKSSVKMETLSQTALFRFLNYRELVAVSGISEYHSAPTGDVLFRDGDEGNCLYLLLSGRVSIIKNNVVIVTLEAGDHFGEMALLDQPRRSAHAVVEKEAAFLIISRDTFYQLMKRNSILAVKLLWNLLLNLSANLRVTSEQLVTDGARSLPTVPDYLDAFLNQP